MIRLLFYTLAGASLLWPQAAARYHYASFSVKNARSGSMSSSPDPAAPRFSLDHPGAPGTALSLAASATGLVLVGTPVSAAPELFVALRAPEPSQAVALAAGEWSAVMLSLVGGKPRGLTTAFLDFSVGFNGAISTATIVSHEAAVDDVSYAQTSAAPPVVSLPPGGLGSLEIFGVKWDLLAAAAGDMFLAVSPAPTHPGLIVALRRDRDATTMAVRGSYALAEIGARNSFSFAPDQARFFATNGTLDTAGSGVATLSQRLIQADRAPSQFQGSAAYMVSAGGAGSFSPRLEQRRRNLAISENGAVMIAAQVAEPGHLSLLHGIGIGVRTLATRDPVLAPSATAQGNVVSLYGRALDGAQVFVGGQPASIVMAAPNQLNIKLSAPPVSPLSVELESQGRRLPPVSIAIASAPPDFASAPPAPGGFTGPAQPVHPGDTIDITVTGAAPPAGTAVLFDGLPGQVLSSAPAAGATQFKVTLPKGLAPAPQVSVALSSPSFYTDLGDIAVVRAPPSH